MITAVDVNATFNVIGEIKPIYVRIEDIHHAIHTCRIKSIKDIRNERYTGMDSILFFCDIELNNELLEIKLRYYVNSHKWSIIKY